MWALDDLEAAAWEDLYDAAPPPLARALRLAHERVDGAAVFRARLPTGLFNRTVGVRALTNALLDATAPGALLQISPFALGADERARLAARGYAARTRWVKLTRPPHDPAPVETALNVVLAGPDHAERFGRTLCAGLELPPSLAPWNAALVGRPGWRCYLACDGDVAVATAAVFVRGDLAWLGAAGTDPAHRGRGAQRALIARRVADAAAAGARLLVCETGAPAAGAKQASLDNLHAAGFADAWERENFVRQG